MRNKIYFVIIVVLALIAFFFFPKKGVNNTLQQVSPSPKTVKEENKTSPVKNISMTAKKWEFAPSEIRVKQGETVKLTIESVDVNHGFSIPEFGVEANLSPNKKEMVEFVASKKGGFTFFCSVFCGEGHRDMKGKLIVE